MLKDSRSRPKNIRLDKQSDVPTVRQLEEMKQKALANGATVELPFGDDTQSVILTVSRDIGSGGWAWMLYRDDGFTSGLEWSHMTPDANYVQALVEGSCPNFLFKKSHKGPIQVSIPDTAADESVKLRKGTLEGHLRNIQIANLLQSVSMGQMTGRLEIVSSADHASVYFSNGKPVHAVLRGAEGNEALIQLFAWEDGEFVFYDESVSVAATITRALTGLMMEGAGYFDHFMYLKNNGMNLESYPVRLSEIASEVEFVEALKGGIDCDTNLQMFIYHQIKGTSSWAEIIRDFSAKKSEWIPAVFNLVNKGLIRFEQAPAVLSKPTGQRVDWSIAAAVENTLCRADTGLYTYAAMLYCVKQEFFRYEIMDVPFSLITFGYCEKSDDSSDVAKFVPFKTRSIAEFRDRIFRAKRKYDLLCHYGAFGYSMVLPLSTKESAKRFAEILADICAHVRVTDSFGSDEVEFRAGVANVAEDCQSLDELMDLVERVRRLAG